MDRLRLLLIVPVLVGLLTLSVFSLGWSAKATRENPIHALGSVHPARELRLIMRRLFETGAISDDGLDRANRALGEAPLEEEPFILAAFSLYNAERYDDANSLLHIARKRSPRSREAQFLAVDVNLALGDIPEAVQNLEVLLRVAPDVRAPTQEALVLIASHPETGRAAMGALRDDSSKAMVLSALAQSQTDPSILLDAIRITGAAKVLKDNPAAIGSFTRPLIDAGHYQSAYQIWSKLVARPSSQVPLVRDGRFREDLPPPFGWELRSSSFGFVGRHSSGLAGEAYGRQSAVLAQQLLLLPAGAFRMNITVDDASDIIETNLKCVKADDIVRFRIERAGTQEIGFVVPSDCPAQWLELEARASDPPRVDAFRINSISIIEDGA